ncbi:uncharacterized protein DNG_01989 [Cephalotrichum gorgonifer]|uniref:RING-type domain-containing protein n=1 Tax=Cephalotrichum gorgonifer TaxID=2041049 RepID=A0AAE8SSA8_9PEZI|nr:uncharacterized protein DNG_01989 [Cephalotrichum gorgonifer]
MGSMVKEHIGVIILGIFIGFAIFGPIACVLYSRRRERKKFHPSPKAFRQARNKLGTVSERKKGTEKGLEGDAEWTDNCPICIAPLLVCPETSDEPSHQAPMVELKAPIAAARGPRASGSNEMSGGAGDGTRSGNTAGDAPVNPPDQAADESPESHVARLLRCLATMKRHRVSSERDVEILKLKSCGHWFHARCLSSWFLIDRYDCPVCRKAYWEGNARRMGPMETFLRSEYSSNPVAARIGHASMVV